MKALSIAGIAFMTTAAMSSTASDQTCTTESAAPSIADGLAAIIDRNDLIWLATPASFEQKVGLIDRIAPIVLFPIIPTDLGDHDTTYSSPALSIMRLDATGGIDPGFGNNGVVTDAMGSRNSRSEANITNIVFDNQGRLVIGGWKERDWALTRTPHELIARRYLPNGEPDEGFARNGFLKDRIDWKYGKTESIAIDSQNRLVIAATEFTTRYNFASALVLLRYQENGRPDRSFGKRGFIKPGVIFGADQTMILATDGEGRYLVAGATPSAEHLMFSGSTLASPSEPGIQVARFTPDGNIDPSFDSTPYVFKDAEGESVNTIGLYVDTQGRVIQAATYIDEQRLRRYTITRRTHSGKLDASFGDAGAITAQITEDRLESLFSATLGRDSQDRAVLSVTYGMDRGTNQDRRSRIVRYTTEGILDRSFGHDGKLELPDVSALNLAFDSSSRLYAIGDRYSCIYIMRYTQDGQPDESFGQALPPDA